MVESRENISKLEEKKNLSPEIRENIEMQMRSPELSFNGLQNRPIFLEDSQREDFNKFKGLSQFNRDVNESISKHFQLLDSSYKTSNRSGDPDEIATSAARIKEQLNKWEEAVEKKRIDSIVRYQNYGKVIRANPNAIDEFQIDSEKERNRIKKGDKLSIISESFDICNKRCEGIDNYCKGIDKCGEVIENRCKSIDKDCEDIDKCSEGIDNKCEISEKTFEINKSASVPILKPSYTFDLFEQKIDNVVKKLDDLEKGVNSLRASTEIMEKSLKLDIDKDHLLILKLAHALQVDLSII